MDGGVASVDTLVYQLEDDDASVRWATLQRLRKRAAVERAQLPVRNPRRFLQCLRRRLGDEDPRIARETLLLLRDLVDVLGDDVELLLSSVLPHLVARLARHGSDEDNEEYSSDSRLDSDAFSVVRKYVTVTNDLAAVANLLVNMGLAHAHARVREAALLALIRLLDERYGGRRLGNASKKSTARVDAALFTELVQAAVPALEDADECVVVAAEEAVAKIQLFWGHAGFQEVMPYLSGEDKATLHAHEETISAFIEAAAQGAGAPPSVSASQVLALRASLPVGVGASAFAAPVTTLRFGFIPNEVVDALQSNRGNSNAEWKKRTAAVEQLYAAAKQVDARVLSHASSAGMDTSVDGGVGSLSELVEILLRLLQDIDVHLVKRSLQIQRLLFAKLESDEDNDGSIISQYVQRVLPALVETSANYAEDAEITAHAYALFQTLFSAASASIPQLTRALLGSLSHRRIQVREEALKIWMVLLLTTPSIKGAINESVVQALGKVLGDGSARVRHMATELAAVLGHVARHDLCAILEAHVDDYTLERIDLDALYARLRDKRLPTLLENGQLRLVEPVDAPKSTANGGGGLKAAATRSPVRTSSHRSASVESGELLDGPSELLQLHRSAHKELRLSSSTARRDPEPTRTSERDYSRNDWRNSETADPTRASAAGAMSRDVSSAPGEPAVDKLQALKRKTELLRKSASSKQVTNRQFNPQEGDVEFAAAGYAAQQQPPPPQQQRAKGLGRARPDPQNDVEEEDAVDPEEVSLRHPAPGRIVRTPRNDDDSDRNLRKPSTVTPRTPPAERYEQTTAAIPGDDRPIRPIRADNLDALIPTEETDFGGRVEVRKRAPVAMSLATKKRLEAKQRQEQQAAAGGDDDDNANEDAYADQYPSEPTPEASKPRALSLATRKRQEQSRAKAEGDADGGGDGSDPTNAKPPKRSSLGGALPPVSGKQEPRYLEPHELLPLKDAKQDAAKVAAQLHADDWEVVFEALNTVRRLAVHHARLLDDKVHAVVTEILKQVPNLRSSVAKNALLALDSLHVALGRQLDGEVDNVVPVLLKRCTDASAFVCESTTQSIHTVIAHCSTARVVNAVAAHLSSRAIAIRREVARSIHAVIIALADQAPVAKEFPTILNVVAKCLEDSNNEVRDAAKQSVLYLNQELGMDRDKIKKLLPASVHGKIEPLLTRAPILGRQREPHAASVNAAAAVKQGDKSSQAAPARRGSTTTTTSGLDNDALAALAAKLDSGNWKDRFDALGELAPFVACHAARLCESGKLLTLFDGLLKRMEDGNAKVATLALELLPAMIASLGDGMEIVLQTFVPVLAKALAASNAKQVALAGASLRALCSHVDARALCPHLAAVARNANSRVKPTLVDALAELAATRDEKLQPALSRYVLPLALELLKEGKSDVKDVTARLLRTLHGALGGATVAHAANKLSSAQQDKLTAILGVRNL